MFLEPPAYGVRPQQPELRRDPTYQRVVFEIEKVLFTKIPCRKESIWESPEREEGGRETREGQKDGRGHV